jgi:predicted ATPase
VPVFLQKVALQNYKSVEACSVSLHPLTLLVGPNGSGKSNFVDALRLVSDSLRTTLEHALRERVGSRKSEGVLAATLHTSGFDLTSYCKESFRHPTHLR